MHDNVLDQYVHHIERLLLRAVTQKRELTHKEQKGVAYYTAAAETVRAFFDRPEPAWARLKFVKSRTL